MNYYYMLKPYVELACEGVIGVAIISCIKIKAPEVKRGLLNLIKNKRNF